jgi:antitoxin component YwqK of YwqJK toxin-antitoxin module
MAIADIGCPNGTVPNGEKTPDVSEAWCELVAAKAVRHGPYRAWYPNGVAGTEENFDYGKLEGKATYRWKNGKVQAVGQYKSGRRDGVWKFWMESGASAGQADYRGGKVLAGTVPNWAVENGAP